MGANGEQWGRSRMTALFALAILAAVIYAAASFSPE